MDVANQNPTFPPLSYLPGRGFDCYRTYEAILLGSIPVLSGENPVLNRDVFEKAPAYVLDREQWVRGKNQTCHDLWMDQICF